MKPLVLVVVLALGLQAVPLSAAGADDTAGTPLTASIHRAVTTAAANSSPSTAPNPMPHRSGKAYFKRQGGGGSSMRCGGRRTEEGARKSSRTCDRHTVDSRNVRLRAAIDRRSQTAVELNRGVRPIEA